MKFNVNILVIVEADHPAHADQLALKQLEDLGLKVSRGYTTPHTAELPGTTREFRDRALGF